MTMTFALSASAAVLDYDEYRQRAAAAAERSDWQSVASQLAQAINHPDQPADPDQRSAVYLAYGRAVGVSCQFEESEKYLLLAQETAKPATRARANALLELGTLSLTRKDYAMAIDYLQQTLQAEAAAGGTARGPILMQAHQGLAAAMQAPDQQPQASSHRAQAVQLQSRARLGVSDIVAPYGARCPGS